MEDELADNSGHENRLQKTEFRAGRKLKDRKGSPFLLKVSLEPGSQQCLVKVAQQTIGFSRVLLVRGGIGSTHRPTGPMPAGMSWYRPTLPVGRVVGPCWHCGKERHFRSKCPLLCGPKQ